MYLHEISLCDVNVCLNSCLKTEHDLIPREFYSFVVYLINAQYLEFSPKVK